MTVAQSSPDPGASQSTGKLPPVAPRRGTGPRAHAGAHGGHGWHRVFLRTSGILAGLGTHVLFAVTVWYLFWFLEGNWEAPAGPLGIDLLLSLQFAIVHSLLLHPRIRKVLSRRIAAPFYGLFFAAVTCAGLLLTFAGWRSQTLCVWQLDGWPAIAMQAGFAVSWAALFYSLYLSGLGYQTGWTPWWYWIRRQRPPRREFAARSLYRWFRHPIYLSFLGLIWFTPRMSLDHALLTIVWTVYIFVGSWLKDRRLELYVGPAYLEYESRVPGYPGLKFGPLGLRPLSDSPQPDQSGRRAA